MAYRFGFVFVSSLVIVVLGSTLAPSTALASDHAAVLNVAQAVTSVPH
jgi:hypothetical protein